MPFEVVYPFELAVNQPASYAHLPRTNDTISGSTDVMDMFANNGATNASGVEVHARIVDASDSTVYDGTDTIASIIAAPRAIMHSFPRFTPGASGEYCVTVWITRDSRDSVPGNDTARWCFYAIVDTSGGQGGGGLSLLPGKLPARASTIGALDVSWHTVNARTSYLSIPDETSTRRRSRRRKDEVRAGRRSLGWTWVHLTETH